jgi:hypothetical protein
VGGVGTLLCGAALGTLGGLTVYMGIIGGGVLIGAVGGVVMRLNISDSLVMAAIVSLETSWKGGGGGGLCSIFIRFVAAMKM